MKQIKNEKGLASIEATILMVVFVMLIGYGVGMFGIVHSAIVNSIAARTYAWETFRHRTNLNYFRDNNATLKPEHTLRSGFRIHGIVSERSSKSDSWEVTERSITLGWPTESVGRRDWNLHNRILASDGPRREQREVNPVWIKTVYGICLDSRCGGVQ